MRDREAGFDHVLALYRVVWLEIISARPGRRLSPRGANVTLLHEDNPATGARRRQACPAASRTAADHKNVGHEIDIVDALFRLLSQVYDSTHLYLST
ncbi:MAG: hypothetical protein WDN02_07460 [Methylovirgula sp.]|uniref:hypothetical protein n=1 Tax=Methylovirgula sp. TaxID=1978224 RepID=UPI0030766857